MSLHLKISKEIEEVKISTDGPLSCWHSYDKRLSSRFYLNKITNRKPQYPHLSFVVTNQIHQYSYTRFSSIYRLKNQVLIDFGSRI